MPYLNQQERDAHVGMVLRGARDAAERRATMREQLRRERKGWGGVKSQATLAARKAAEGERRSPAEALAERDRIAGQPMTLAQMYLGDPPAGRSALDRRQRA